MKMSDLGSEITVKDDRLSMGRVYGLETWKTDDKWNGKPSARKSYIQRTEGILKRYPEMMATWNSRGHSSRKRRTEPDARRPKDLPGRNADGTPERNHTISYAF